MVDREASRLKEMNLTKLTKDDLIVPLDDDWESRTYLHDKLQNSSLITKKPIGQYFEFEENVIEKDYIACHLMIPVVVTEIKKNPNSASAESEESEDTDEEAEIDADDFNLDIDDNPTPAETSAAEISAGMNIG